MQIKFSDFRPANDIIEKQGGVYESVGSDPHFLYVTNSRLICPGFYLFECSLRSPALSFSPYLYIDAGDGFSEQRKITLPSPNHNGDISLLIELPEGARSLRFDPLDEAGEFQCEFLTIKSVSRFGLLWMLIKPYIRNLKSHPNLAGAYFKKFCRLLLSGDNITQHLKTAPSLSYRNWLEQAEKNYGFNSWTKNQIQELKLQPKISIVMPTYNTDASFFTQVIDSILEQSYPNWELCIADDASTDKSFQSLLNKIELKDNRIRIVRRPINGHISAASNSALEICTGEFVCLVDHDDMVHPQALAEFVIAINNNPEIDIWYSDEDKLTSTGYDNPTLKPDWSPHLLFSQQYIGHLVCIKLSSILAIGGFNSQVNGAQDHDLLLRLADAKARFGHIPKILYHWREHINSTATNPDSKPYAHVAGELAVSRALIKKYGDLVTGAESGGYLYTFRPIFSSKAIMPVSIIIPTRDGLDLLSACIDSIVKKTTDCVYEIIIVDNGSREKKTFDYFESIKKSFDNIKIISADIDFNWSMLNNIGVQHAKYDVFVFLNNDIEVIEPKWLYWLSGYANLPDVGTVGALLLYPDDTIQHAGVVVGMHGWADHIFKAIEPKHLGTPFTSPALTRNVLANTGACMAISRQKYNLVGGFDEDFIVCGSDVEICLRFEANNLKNLYCPHAMLYHFESKTRDPSKVPEGDFIQSSIKYEPFRTLRCDPYFNVNLDINSNVPNIKF